MTDGLAGQSLTGERTLPHIWHENYWFRRHEVAYRYLADVLKAAGGSAMVLDAGCGEGYGSALLAAASGGRVVAVDYDVPTLRHLHVTYPELLPLKGNLVALPIVSGSVDAVVSLQVIEHIWEQPRFVAECARVVGRRGWLAISTPNRLTFSPGLGRGEKPVNPFHVNELDATELVALLAKVFEDVKMVGVHHGPRIRQWEAQHGPIVAAQLAKPHTSWPEALVAFVSSLTVDDFMMGSHEIDNSLDLLVVARHE